MRLVSVFKRYALPEGQFVTALDDVNLSIDAGDVVAVTGPSGSGKSTLLHVVGAMDRPDGGSVKVGHLEVTALKRKDQASFRRGIGFVFQRFHLLPALSVLDNVAAPLLPYKTNFDKFVRAQELLAATGLSGREKTLPSRLSGGQQQRVAIARALINRPSLLLADEPTGNLDSRTGTEIVELLLRLRNEYGMTILVATHDPNVAQRCDRIVAMRDGKLTSDARLGEEADRLTLPDEAF